MDVAAFLNGLTQLFSVGGVPLAVLGLVAWAWLQDRHKSDDEDGGDWRKSVEKRLDRSDDWRKSVETRLAKIEAKIDLLWK